MARKEHSFEVRFKAEDMFVYEHFTHEEIADRLDVGLSTIKTWSSGDGWKQLRQEYLEKNRSIRQKLTELRDSMLDTAVTSKDPHQVYAALRVLKEEREREKKADSKAPDIDRPKIFLEDMEFVAEVLKEVDPEGLKILARNFDALVVRFKAEYAKTT